MPHQVMELLRWILNAVADYKILFERSLSFSDDAVHIFAGILIQFLCALVLRLSIAHWRPLLAVVVLELANEILDIRHDVWPSPGMQLGESVKDVLLTLVVPSVLFAASRWAPAVLVSVRPEERSTTGATAEEEATS